MNSRRSFRIPLPGLAWRGFTLQVFFFIFLPLAALLLAAAFWSQGLHHDAMREMVGDRDLRAVRAAANSIGEEAAHRSEIINMLAGQSTGTKLPGGSYEEAFPGGLVLLSPSGRLLSAAMGTPLATLTAEERLSLINEGREISSPFTLPGDPQPWAAVFARRADGNILAGAFSPAALVRQAVRGALDPAQTTVRMAAPGGVILYQVGPEANTGLVGMDSALAGESGIDYHHSPDGEHVIAFSPVAGLGWGLVLEESWESIASPALNTTQWMPLVLAPLLVFALLALWFGARQVIQPLQSLQAGTAELARGNFEAVEEPVGGISEIRMLQADLAVMARRLHSAQESLRGYIGAITAGIENERLSLARELHDDTLQTLIALQQRIQLASRGTRGKDESLRAVQEQVQQTITNLRRMVRGLRPIYLEDLGLPAALEMLVKENAQAAGIEIGFRVEGVERRLTPESELALFRITQEALSNVSRHAAAGQAHVEIQYLPDCVALTVQDDGKGFQPPESPAEFARRGHFGLVGMAERAEIIGARLAIRSVPGQGTELRVEVPAGN